MKIQKDCPICSSTNVKNVFQSFMTEDNCLLYNVLIRKNPVLKKYIKRTYSLLIKKCLDCKHLYQYNIFNEKEENEYHKHFILADWVSDYYKNLDIIIDELKGFNSIKEFQTILDVGAAFGEFCFAAKALRLEPFAYDICLKSNKFLKNNSINLYDNLKNINRKFDVIRVSHVLSHIHNNHETLIFNLIDLLEPDGIICFSDHISENNDDLQIIKSPLIHVNVFSEKSFNILMRKFPLKEINTNKCYRRING